MKVQLLILCILAIATTARADEIDTIYLRDGSVVNGAAARRGSGDWQVKSKFGVLNVSAGDVLYVRQHETPPPVVEENHFFIDETTRTLSVIMQDIPERTDETSAFNLLMPGEVESVMTDSGSSVKFTRRPVGEHSLISVEYASVPMGAKRIRIVLWQESLLERVDTNAIKFQRKYTPDREGLIVITVKYPRQWKVRAVEPRPEKSAEGLIVWRQSVAREQEFSPEAVFTTKE